MTDTLKVLAQSNPVATTLTDAYTVPAATTVVVSSIVVANRSSTATTYRISVAIAGAADDNKQYIAYDAPINGNDVVPLLLGLSLGATDVIRVYAGAATLSFNIFGVQVT